MICDEYSLAMDRCLVVYRYWIMHSVHAFRRRRGTQGGRRSWQAEYDLLNTSRPTCPVLPFYPLPPDLLTNHPAERQV